MPFVSGFHLKLQFAFAGVGKGFIDATKCGNIGRFINHSCSPNLHVKDVMYDHDDKNLPHKMLFAAKDIPAGRELSIDIVELVENLPCRNGSHIMGSSLLLILSIFPRPHITRIHRSSIIKFASF